MPSIPLTEYPRSVTIPQNLRMKEENPMKYDFILTSEQQALVEQNM